MHVHVRDLDLRTAQPFGIARWTNTDFANYVVELHGDEGVHGEGARGEGVRGESVHGEG
jgi:hypothetical protein